MVKGIIYIAVTNDTRQDQRMIRMATILTNNQYKVVLTGCGNRTTQFKKRIFKTKLINTVFKRGMLFYLEYNLKLLFFLLSHKMDGVVSVDLDTIIACRTASFLKRKKLIFDAHEYFVNVPELIDRPFKRALWIWIEKIFVKNLTLATTVNHSLAEKFTERYHYAFEVIRNIPEADNLPNFKKTLPNGNILLLYQGVLNVGRGLEIYIEALEQLPNCMLYICGKGDIERKLNEMIRHSPCRDRIEMKGFLDPEELIKVTKMCHIGLNLLDPGSKSYYYSLANRYFDYIYAGLPAIHMDFPEYRRHNIEAETSILIKDYNADALSEAISTLISTPGLYDRLSHNCVVAKKYFSSLDENKKFLELVDGLFEN